MKRRCVALIGLALAGMAAVDHVAEYRASVIARAKVWHPTNVAAMNITAGPDQSGPLAIGDTLRCTYVDKKVAGNTPKFWCPADGEEVKVKVGAPENGEVFAEVIATRLLWALGFGADRMYLARVICHGCPSSLKGSTRNSADTVFDPAAVELKMPGKAFEPDDGWKWDELDLVSEQAGGATRAERDALKLLAVFMQHTDNKKEQQRLSCLGDKNFLTMFDRNADRPVSTTGAIQNARPTSTKGSTQNEPATASSGDMACAHPFMLINDLGMTFGKANYRNKNKPGSANLVEWSSTPIWRDERGCVGHLSKAMTGTLGDPVISEDGRRFLADLLMQLSDRQIHDLFEAARVTERLRNPEDPHSGFPTVDEWVAAFKAKRAEIVNHRCSAT